MSESINSKMNHKLLMRIGDVPLRYADQINITNDGDITGDSYTLNYNANHVMNDDIAVGLKFNNGMVNYDESTTNVGSGGDTPVVPTGSTEGYKVQYFDYDGTILKTEYVLTGGTSTPPVTPTHDLLTFNSWNNDNTNITRDTDIGAIYDTTDGKTHCFIIMGLGNYQPKIYLNKTGSTDITVDWGDGEISITGATGEFSIQKPTPYSSGTTGMVSYTITIDCDDVYGLGNPSLNRKLISQTNLYLDKCYIGRNIPTIDEYFISSIGYLRSIVIPNSVTSLGDVCFSSSNISQLIIPNSVMSLGDGCFETCSTLQSIIIPNSVMSLGDSCFFYCSALQSIVIPNSVTSLGGAFFENCTSLISIEFTSLLPPLISGEIFTNMIRFFIYVPDASLEAYRTDVNFSVYANKIYPISAKPIE